MPGGSASLDPRVTFSIWTNLSLNRLCRWVLIHSPVRGHESWLTTDLCRVTWSRWALSFRMIKRVLAITHIEWKVTTFLSNFPLSCEKIKFLASKFLICSWLMRRPRTAGTSRSCGGLDLTQNCGYFPLEVSYRENGLRCYLCNRAVQRAEVNRNYVKNDLNSCFVKLYRFSSKVQCQTVQWYLQISVKVFDCISNVRIWESLQPSENI